MFKHLIMLVLMAGLATYSQGRQLPEGVQKIVDNYVKDSTQEDGFLFAKRFLMLDTSIKSSDIQVGEPLEEYAIKYSILDTCTEAISIPDLIYPVNYWYLPIQARGKFIYEVKINLEGKSWHTCGLAELETGSFWEKLHKSYLKHNGIFPIIITKGPFRYLYFKEKSTHNFFSIRPKTFTDSLTLVASKSLDTLDDSRKILRLLIKEYRQDKPKRDELNAKYPNIFKRFINDGEK